MDWSTPGSPVHHQLLELTQAHVHWDSDAIQQSHTVIPFSSCLQSFSASGSFQMSQFFSSEDLRENHCCKPLQGSLVENVLYSVKMWLGHQVVSDSCDPISCSPPGSSVHGISQTRILEWVAISFSRGSFWPRDWTRVSWTAGGFYTDLATREAYPIKIWPAK